MNQDSSGGDAITGINVTPFVDIILVVLVIFLVSAKLVSRSAHVLNTKLPKSGVATVSQAPHVINLAESGALDCDGKPVTLSDDAWLKQLGAEDKVSVVIAADSQVVHQRVIALMSRLSAAGIENIAFAVTPTAP